MTTYRGCGTCTACCTVLDVPELDKPEGVPCQHLTDQGCGIYEDRPEACRNFKCGYLLRIDDWPTRMRPDQSGFMIAEVPRAKDRFMVDVAYQMFIHPDTKESDWGFQVAKKKLEKIMQRAKGKGLKVAWLWRWKQGHLYWTAEEAFKKEEHASVYIESKPSTWGRGHSQGEKDGPRKND